MGAKIFEVDPTRSKDIRRFPKTFRRLQTFFNVVSLQIQPRRGEFINIIVDIYFSGTARDKELD